MSHAVHAGEQSRVSGRPHDVVHVVGVVLKRVEGLVVLHRLETGPELQLKEGAGV